MLDAVEPIPAQLSAAVDGDRPGPRSVVDEVAFRGAVVVDVEYGVVGNVVAVEVGQRVIAQTVASRSRPIASSRPSPSRSTSNGRFQIPALPSSPAMQYSTTVLTRLPS